LNSQTLRISYSSDWPLTSIKTDLGFRVCVVSARIAIARRHSGSRGIDSLEVPLRTREPPHRDSKPGRPSCRLSPPG
jgi:hypothetical protein